MPKTAAAEIAVTGIDIGNNSFLTCNSQLCVTVKGDPS